MAVLHSDTNKYDDGEGPPIVEAYHSALKSLIRQRLDERKCSWPDFVFGASYELLTTDDMSPSRRRCWPAGTASRARQ